LTTIISLTSFLLLDIKYCNGNITNGKGGNSAPWTMALFAKRKSFNIDRSMVELLLVFIFEALGGKRKDSIMQSMF